MNLSEKKLGPSVELAHLYSNGGAVWAALPWISRAVIDAERGLKMAKEIKDKIREGCGYAYLSFTSYFTGKAKTGLENAQKSIKLLKSVGEYWELGTAFAFRVYCDSVLGRLREGIEDSNEFINLCETLKLWQPLIWAHFLKCKTMCLIGDVDEIAIKHIEEAEKIRSRLGELMHIMYIPAISAFAYFRRKEYDKAVDNMDRALKLFYANYFSKVGWTMDFFAMGAEVYLGKIINTPDLSFKEKNAYLKKAHHCCWQAMFWGRICKVFLPWGYQVNGTYLWLTGKKKKAVKTWEKGIKFLREKTADKYRLASVLLEEATYLLQDNPNDKKALEYLLESKELFIESGCKIED